jgi:hypothetical protein
MENHRGQLIRRHTAGAHYRTPTTWNIPLAIVVWLRGYRRWVGPGSCQKAPIMVASPLEVGERVQGMEWAFSWAVARGASRPCHSGVLRVILTSSSKTRTDFPSFTYTPSGPVFGASIVFQVTNSSGVFSGSAHACRQVVLEYVNIRSPPTWWLQCSSSSIPVRFPLSVY